MRRNLRFRRRTPEIEVQWLTSSDGWVSEALVPGQTTVHVGGGSETDWAFTPEGTVIAVMRNEAGDADGWGSKICRGEAHAIGDWTCMPDPKKYDSPLVFSHQNRIWLIARRNVTDSGAYDLEMRDLDPRDQTTAYSIDYWQHPKRCSLWEIDAESLRVSWVLDLPSKGDTCFASMLPAGDDRYTVYNYRSDPKGDDLGWLQGQTQPTQIYRQDLVFRSDCRVAPAMPNSLFKSTLLRIPLNTKRLVFFQLDVRRKSTTLPVVNGDRMSTWSIGLTSHIGGPL